MHLIIHTYFYFDLHTYTVYSQIFLLFILGGGLGVLF